MKVSFIIPAFNEMHTVGKVVSLLKQARLGADKEIMIVDDGSADRTQETASKIRGVEYLRLAKNEGKGVQSKRA